MVAKDAFTPFGANAPSKLFEGTRPLIEGATNALVKRAIESEDLRKDLVPFDLLRALIGVSNVATSPDWQQSAQEARGYPHRRFAGQSIVGTISH